MLHFFCFVRLLLLLLSKPYLLVSTTSVGPSTLHTESSGVLDGSASVISASWWIFARFFACNALSLLPFF